MSELAQQVMIKNVMKAFGLTPEKLEAMVAPYATPVIEGIKNVREKLTQIEARLQSIEMKQNEIETNMRVLMKDTEHDAFLEQLKNNCIVTQAMQPTNEPPQLQTEEFYQR